MKIEVEISDYDPTTGLQTEWDEHYVFKSEWHQQYGEFLIKGDAAALRELAIHLLTLAQEEVPAGTHIHYDSWRYSMEPGSTPFIVEKV